MSGTYKPNIRRNPPYEYQVANLVKFFNVEKNLGMLCSPRFFYGIYVKFMKDGCLPSGVFQCGDNFQANFKKKIF